MSTLLLPRPMAGSGRIQGHPRATKNKIQKTSTNQHPQSHSKLVQLLDSTEWYSCSELLLLLLLLHRKGNASLMGAERGIYGQQMFSHHQTETILDTTVGVSG